MKTVISFCLVALVFFCSCKSNSFLTQRYTNFDNSSKKPHKIHAPEKQGHITAASYASVPLLPRIAPAEPSEGYVHNTTGLDFEKKARATSSPKENVTEPFNTLHPTKLSGLTNSIRVSSDQLIKSSRNITGSHQGLIFGIINLAFFIVICVLVAAGIIFLLTVLL